MSVESKELERECDSREGGGALDAIITAAGRDLGEVTVRRSLPTRALRHVGPWIFFDHMGPVTFRPGPGIGVRPHPHINIATVTYLFEGEIMHRDSLGTEQAIRPGALNLMVAGRGIVHSERERAEVLETERRLHGLQLWLALPEECEEIEPAFYHYPAAEMPSKEVAGVPVRVLMGAAYGIASPVKTYSETLYVEAQLRAGDELELPETEERAVYVATGRLRVRDEFVAEHSLAVLRPGARATVCATETTRLAIIGGRSVGKRFMDWNFASSRQERIVQAKEDWQSKRFPLVPGDENEFIPYPG